MRHIIHKFVNVYHYIAYSCEVDIHIIISWILGSGPRWYGKWHSHVIQEQGNNYSWVDCIAFLFEVFKYLFKKLFFRQIFLKSIYFSSCKIPKNQESVWYHHSCCQWHKEDLSNSWIKDTRWKVMIILGYWTLHHFHTQTLQSLHLDWWYFRRWGNDFWRIYTDFWVQIWQVNVKLWVLSP